MADALRLYGLKAIVMAGASGISEAIARTLVKHGALVLALDTEASGVESVYRSVRGVTGKALDANTDDIGSAVVAAAVILACKDVPCPSFTSTSIPTTSCLLHACQASGVSYADATGCGFGPPAVAVRSDVSCARCADSSCSLAAHD